MAERYDLNAREEAVLERLRAFATPQAAVDPELDDLIAGAVEDRLLPAERTRLLDLLGNDPQAVDILNVLVQEERPAAARVAEPTFRARHWPFVAAAALLLGALLVAQLFKEDLPPAPNLETQMAQHAQATQGEHPLLAGFAPFSTEELRSLGESVTRDGLAMLHPRETIRSSRPTFTWDLGVMPEACQIRVFDEEGVQVLSRNVELPAGRFDWPDNAQPLAPGAYSWTLTCEAPARSWGDPNDARSFRVASAREVAAFDAAVPALTDDAPASVRALLHAHFALRSGWLLESENVLPDARDAQLTRDTREYLRRRLRAQ